jgi:exopolyphosphatase / guanosine-5'-triphosphate,3'-diphosphate pyrophosphatase
MAAVLVTRASWHHVGGPDGRRRRQSVARTATPAIPLVMVCACVDIGTNTTRVLVAEAEGGRLVERHQERAFTRIGAHGRIAEHKIAEVAAVVDAQVQTAMRLGAEQVRVVATAAVRGAGNREQLLAAIPHDVVVLAGEEEARLAFLGATSTYGGPLDGRVAVVDVGGGSTEIAAGRAGGAVEWWASTPIGSSALADRHIRSDPPARGELAALRAEADAALGPLDPPAPGRALAVGGSAASLRALVGDVLDQAALERALGVLCGDSVKGVAARFGLDPLRVRLLPAGILILAAAAARLGQPLQIGCGGLREGVVLDMARTL